MRMSLRFLYCAIHRYNDCSCDLNAALSFILLTPKPPFCIPPWTVEHGSSHQGKGTCLKLAAVKPVKLASHCLYGD